MPDNPVKEAFLDLLTHIDHLETQTAAMREFLREHVQLTDEKLAPYLENASRASDVRTRAARARLEHLFTADEKARPATEAVSQPHPNSSQEQQPPQPAHKEESQRRPGPGNEKPSPEGSRPTSGKQSEPSEIIAGRQAGDSPTAKESVHGNKEVA